MEESFHHMVVLPSHKFERNFPQPGGKHLRPLTAVQYDVDLMAAARQGIRHPEEADFRHRRRREIRTAIAKIDARDAEPWPIRHRSLIEVVQAAKCSHRNGAPNA